MYMGQDYEHVIRITQILNMDRQIATPVTYKVSGRGIFTKLASCSKETRYQH